MSKFYFTYFRLETCLIKKGESNAPTPAPAGRIPIRTPTMTGLIDIGP